MAIYHLEAKAISRGVGRSAVAASAYMSCSRIYNDYDGIQHDYTIKQGLVYEQVLLPPQALPEWKDRSVLWNAVEEAEKAKDSRLAREFVVALPIELGKDEWISLLTEYVQDNFVNDGMCADVCIHDTDGHNPHAHILLTVRPLAENGKWQSKTEKEYLCIKDGEERGFTAKEFKIAQADGWEKQYQYLVGKKKVYMPPSQAEQQGYERASKYPKSTRYGRQNPITERWNSEQQLLIWRRNWAEINNRYLEKHNIQSRIDHRSHKERGIDDQPTIHEGAAARIMEQRGYTSERCEINRQIKADNKLLSELKAQVKKLLKVVKNTIPAIADALETVRKNVMIFSYNIFKSRSNIKSTADKLKNARHSIKRYSEAAKQLKAKITERKSAQAQKETIPIYSIKKRKELTQTIERLTEEIEELRTEKNMLLKNMKCENDKDVSKVKLSIPDIEKKLTSMQEQEGKDAAELKAALGEFKELKSQSEDFDKYALIDERLAIRPQKQQEFYDYVSQTDGDNYSPTALSETLSNTDRLLNENLEFEQKSLLNKLNRYKEQSHNDRKQHKSHDEWDMEL